ncbi:MAG: DUF4476 domain-containing protein [Flavobacteriales bacterium]|nr:DUF4476 domain-containing protein [Flavobacteriales bacterium]
MKKILLSLIAIIATGITWAQTSNLIFFTEGGERFRLILNGIQQNVESQTNVKVTDLSPGAWKVKVLFDDAQLQPVDKTIYMEPAMEYTANVKQNNKGVYVVRLLNQVPIAQALPPVQNQQVIVYHTSPPQATSVTVTETTTSHSATTSDNVNVNAGVGGVGISMNVNINDGTGKTSSQTTTTTTSYSSTTVVQPTQPVQQVYAMPGYNGPVGCPMPMAPADFSAAKQSISQKSFNDSKLTMAKQITQSNCLTAEQVRELTLLLDFEESKLDYTKFAYDYTYDIGNYFKVNDAFDFEMSIEELNQHIAGKRR